MQTAKLFINGQSQAVRLPKECRFSGQEVGIKKVGNIVLLYQDDTAWSNFLNTEPIDDDLGNSILQARNEEISSERDTL